MVTALIVLAFFEECGTAFLVDEPGRRVGESAVRVGRSFTPLGIEEHRPAGAEALQHVVRPRAGRDQLGLGGGFAIGSAAAEPPQEAAVPVENEKIGRESCRERVCQYWYI